MCVCVLGGELEKGYYTHFVFTNDCYAKRFSYRYQDMHDIIGSQGF